MPTLKKNLTLDYFYVHNFRGLNHLKLEDFSNVNIFVGANNSGKTSILEALKDIIKINKEDR